MKSWNLAYHTWSQLNDLVVDNQVVGVVKIAKEKGSLDQQSFYQHRWLFIRACYYNLR